MGINTHTFVPATVDLGDLIHAIGRLTDADEVRLQPTGGRGLTGEAYWERGMENAWSPFFSLEISRKRGWGEDFDGETPHSHFGHVHLGSYHRDWNQGGEEGKLLIFGTHVSGGNATAFWAALGVGLVNHFGGVVDFNDCDSNYADVVRRATPYAKITDGDERWVRAQNALKKLKPVDLSVFDETVGIYNRRGEYVG